MQDTAGRGGNIEKLFASGRDRHDRVIMDLLRYWETLRAGRLAPARSEIDPREIKSALKYTFILEFDPVGGIRFRLAGEKICALMGMDLRGMPAYSLIDISDRQEFEQTLHTMTRKPEIVEYRLAGTCGAQRPTAARMLLLPMLDAEGNITRVLGGLSMRTPLFDPPLRFELVEKMRTRIVAGTGQSALPSDSGLAEEAAPFAPREQTAEQADDAARQPPNQDADDQDMPRVRYLRVVTDDYGQTRK